MTFDDVVRTLIQNGWTAALEDGTVATAENRDEIGEDDVQVGYECEDCGHRIHGVTTESGELPECEQCGCGFWNRVVNDIKVVYGGD